MNTVIKHDRTMYVGRASVAIYLLLKGMQAAEGKVVVPANLCYAAIFPIIYAGLQPQFCDVDRYSGNVTFESVKDTITEDTVAAIIPHMYGNPVKDFVQISELCKNRNIYLIQDSASAMGITPRGYDVTTVADAIVYSTGYSKTVDLGGGGLLYIREGSIEKYKMMEMTLPSFPIDGKAKIYFFSKLYRLLRDAGQGLDISDVFYSLIKDLYQECLVYRIDDAERRRILEGLDGLAVIVEQRRKAKKIYDSMLLHLLDEIEYVYMDGAVPWRYNILVEPVKRKNLIKKCLENDISISDWYPSVLPIFGRRDYFPGVEWHAEHILNFPLLISEREIYKICRVIVSELK